MSVVEPVLPPKKGKKKASSEAAQEGEEGEEGTQGARFSGRERPRSRAELGTCAAKNLSHHNTLLYWAHEAAEKARLFEHSPLHDSYRRHAARITELVDTDTSASNFLKSMRESDKGVQFWLEYAWLFAWFADLTNDAFVLALKDNHIGIESKREFYTGVLIKPNPASPPLLPYAEAASDMVRELERAAFVANWMDKRARRE